MAGQPACEFSVALRCHGLQQLRDCVGERGGAGLVVPVCMLRARGQRTRRIFASRVSAATPRPDFILCMTEQPLSLYTVSGALKPIVLQLTCL